MAALAEREGALLSWLGANLPGSGAVAVAPLAATGESNQMFELARGEERWVLRCPPAAKNDPSAHDVLREYRLLVALEGTAVPHPRPLLSCSDLEVLGVPFYVMERVDGFSPVEPLAEPYASNVAARHALGLLAVDALAQIAAAPWRQLGLEGFGRPEGFLGRQVGRWLGQLDSYRVRELAGLEEVAAWLSANVPPDAEPAIVHGDFGLRNLMVAADPVRLVAVIDWEMATIGDPLIDLGLLLATWSLEGEAELVTRSVTGRDGIATRVEMAERYAERSGRSIEAIDYYMALALFKFGCILEGSYARYLAGTSTHPTHGFYEVLVPRIFARAEAIAAGTWGLEGAIG